MNPGFKAGESFLGKGLKPIPNNVFERPLSLRKWSPRRGSIVLRDKHTRHRAIQAKEHRGVLLLLGLH
jgi:hypothetical protein